MLACLTGEQRPSCEPMALDATLAASAVEQDMLAESAYEAALRLDAERWWVPTRLRQSAMDDCEVPA